MNEVAEAPVDISEPPNLLMSVNEPLAGIPSLTPALLLVLKVVFNDPGESLVGKGHDSVVQDRR